MLYFVGFSYQSGQVFLERPEGVCFVVARKVPASRSTSQQACEQGNRACSGIHNLRTPMLCKQQERSELSCSLPHEAGSVKVPASTFPSNWDAHGVHRGRNAHTSDRTLAFQSRHLILGLADRCSGTPVVVLRLYKCSKETEFEFVHALRFHSSASLLAGMALLTSGQVGVVSSTYACVMDLCHALYHSAVRHI